MLNWFIGWTWTEYHIKCMVIARSEDVGFFIWRVVEWLAGMARFTGLAQLMPSFLLQFLLWAGSLAKISARATGISANRGIPAAFSYRHNKNVMIMSRLSLEKRASLTRLCSKSIKNCALIKFHWFFALICSICYSGLTADPQALCWLSRFTISGS